VIVLDSSFIVAFHNERDAHHGPARGWIERFLQGEWGAACCSSTFSWKWAGCCSTPASWISSPVPIYFRTHSGYLRARAERA
jgi:hypothetical protein